MSFSINKEGTAIIVKPLVDTINAEVCKEFKNTALSQINENNCLMLIDFSQVDFVDSSGLGSLVTIFKSIESHKGLLVLCGIKAPVLNIIKLCKFDKVFTIISNEKEALNHLLAHK